MPSPQLQEYEKLLLLPRELRDMIYPHVVTEASPIALVSPAGSSSENNRAKQHRHDPHPITRLGSSHPIIAAEALEVYWQCNTFILNFYPRDPHIRTWIHHTVPKSHIQRLIVSADEDPATLFSSYFNPDGASHYLTHFECTQWESQTRQKWGELLLFPKLKSLTINMAKTERSSFYWMLFAPILVELRSRIPGIEINFNISYDEILKKEWYHPRWVATPADVVEYKPAGYIDVSDIFAPATDDDKQYVAKYIPQKIMPPGRDVILGLLSEPPAQRRLLGPLYLVKEPELLRVLMEEQWVLYKACERDRALNNGA